MYNWTLINSFQRTDMNESRNQVGNHIECNEKS